MFTPLFTFRSRNERLGTILEATNNKEESTIYFNVFQIQEASESKMPIQLKEENCGKVLVVHVTGRLVEMDYEQFVPDLERLTVKHGKLRLLFDVTDFPGWNAGALWEDTRFADNRFTDVVKLAMVGEKNCQRGMAIFCKPFTRAITRYFDRDNAHNGRHWLRWTLPIN